VLALEQVFRIAVAESRVGLLDGIFAAEQSRDTPAAALIEVPVQFRTRPLLE